MYARQSNDQRMTDKMYPSSSQIVLTTGVQITVITRSQEQDRCRLCHSPGTVVSLYRSCFPLHIIRFLSLFQNMKKKKIDNDAIT